MAHVKLNEADDDFLSISQGGVLVSSGISGTETFIERDRDTTVRIVLQTVAVATLDGAVLEACIEVGGANARGEDGPSPADSHLQASQSVQVVVKAGERISFKAYPKSANARVLRTVVYTSDMK
jgi:hypothetical protein